LDLRGTKSLENLKEAFARDAQGNRRYLYFARRADIEGHADIGGMFRDICEAETAHAFGDLDFLKQIGDPITDEPIGDTKANLRAAIASETYDGVEVYPGFAKIAREENFQELAEWFEVLARAERSHTARLRQALENIS
jgi:rubrerythrin